MVSFSLRSDSQVLNIPCKALPFLIFPQLCPTITSLNSFLSPILFSICCSYSGFLSVSQACQVFCHRALAWAVPSAWNILSPDICMIHSLIPFSLSQVECKLHEGRGFPFSTVITPVSRTLLHSGHLNIFCKEKGSKEVKKESGGGRHGAKLKFMDMKI